MPDYKRIAEELRRYIDDPSLGKDQVAQMAMEREVGCAVINTLPAILSALELAAAVERLKAWQLDDKDGIRKFTIEPDDASVEGFTAHLSIDHYDGTIDGDCASHESSLPAAINAALDAAEKPQ